MVKNPVLEAHHEGHGVHAVCVGVRGAPLGVDTPGVLGRCRRVRVVGCQYAVTWQADRTSQHAALGHSFMARVPKHPEKLHAAPKLCSRAAFHDDIFYAWYAPLNPV